MTEALAFLERRVLAAGGIATRSQLHDVSQWTLRRAVTEGVLVRDTRGAYAVPQIVSDARAARRLSGALSHLSAALAHGWSGRAHAATADRRATRAPAAAAGRRL